MRKNIKTITGCILLSGALALSLAACGSQTAQNSKETVQTESSSSVTMPVTRAAADTEDVTAQSTAEEITAAAETEAASESKAQNTEVVTTVANVTSDGAIDAADMFTNRDLRQTADTSEAEYYTVSDGQNIEITSAGVYVISGTAQNVSVIVDADDEDKVQIVLDGVDIENDDQPVIYVKNADKVFVTTAEDSENYLWVTGTFTADGTTNTDAVIFSKDDLVLNGLGYLNISSTDNGISCKDDLKITGGEIEITCVSDGLEANDSIAVADGDISIVTKKDGFHAENDDDDSLGYIYICGGKIYIEAGDDGIHGTTIIQIDGGDLTITAAEGIEATYVQINGGDIYIKASDDGINAGRKSSAYSPVIEFNGGYTTVVMGAGDTDGIDSNGDIYVNGGIIDVTGNSTFDYDGTAEYNGGTIIVNGNETTTIPNQFGGGRGGMGGGPGGRR